MSYLFNDKVQIAGNPVRTTNENQSQFGETIVTSKTPVVNLNSSYGTSMLRDVEIVTGSGSIIPSNGKIALSSGTTAGSMVELDSAEGGTYISGYTSQIGMGIRIPSLPVGTEYSQWGGLSFDKENGFYFGIDSTDLYIARRVGGIEYDKIYKSNFNIDKLNGIKPSKYNLDVNVGHIFQIDYTWYGYGQILFGIVAVLPDSSTNGRDYIQQFIPCHSMKIPGEVSTYNPTFKIHTELSNGSEETDFTMHVGGRQYSIIGEYIPKYRFTSDYRTDVTFDTTEIPLISFQRKSSFIDRTIKIEGFESLVADVPCLLQVRVSPTLTGASFGNPTNHMASETALESDTSATAISGGMVVWQQILSASAKNESTDLASKNIDIDIPDDSIISLTVTALGVGTGTISSLFRIREQW